MRHKNDQLARCKRVNIGTMCRGLERLLERRAGCSEGEIAGTVRGPSGERLVARSVLGTLKARCRDGETREGVHLVIDGKDHLLTPDAELFRILESHFVQRWNERGRPDLIPARHLELELHRAFIGNRSEVEIAYVMDTENGVPIYRFLVGGEVFYVLKGDTGWPTTVYLQSFVARKRRARKRHAKIAPSNTSHPMFREIAK